MPTIRQMYGGMYNFYKMFYSGRNNFRKTVSSKNITAQNKYTDNLSELKKSAAKIKNINLADENSVSEVKNFLSEYNSANKFSSSNKYESKIYDSIGITTNLDGTLKLDENKFNTAAKNNSGRVTSILKNLANKAENIQSTQTLYNRAGYNNYSSIGNFFNYLL